MGRVPVMKKDRIPKMFRSTEALTPPVVRWDRSDRAGLTAARHALNGSRDERYPDKTARHARAPSAQRATVRSRGPPCREEVMLTKAGLLWARALAGESHVLALLKKEHAAKHSAHAVVEEEDTAEAVHPVLLSGDVEILKRRVIDGHAVDKWSTR